MWNNFLGISFRLSIIIWKKISYSLFGNIFRKNSHHIETSRLICIVNQFDSFYKIQLFTKRWFQTGYNFVYKFNLMQWCGAKLREDGEAIKELLFREDNTPLHTINCFLNSNNNVCSLYLIDWERCNSNTIASHIQVTTSFNLPNSIKWIVWYLQ